MLGYFCLKYTINGEKMEKSEKINELDRQDYLIR